MPLNKKGRNILESMVHTYKNKKKAKQVFYASVNAKKIKGIAKGKKK